MNASTGIRRHALLGPPLVALLAIGCATMRVHTDHDPTASFAGMTTYAWELSPPDAGVGGPWVHNALLERRVVEAVDRHLAAKGYRRVESGEPDFLVDYHAAIENRMSAATSYGWHGPPENRPDPTTEVVYYREGTLILDVVDPATRRQIWRGWAIDVVDDEMRPEWLEAKVDEAVGKILERFPPEGADRR